MEARPRRPLGLRQIEILHWIMTTGSLTGAAAAMTTSQPTISRDLARLERALGRRLFRREGRRLVATEEARQIHAEIAKNYLCAEAVAELAAQILGGVRGRVRVAAVPSLALRAVPDALCALIRDHPLCSFDLQVHSRDSIAGFLREGQFDVAFTVLGGDSGQLPAERLATVEAVCVCHRASRLAALDVVTPADLADEPFISLAPSYLSRLKVDEVFLRARVTPRVFMTTQTAISACGMIARGHGVTVIDPLTAAFAEGAAIAARPFRPEVRFDYVALVPGREADRPLVAGLIARLRAILQPFDALAPGRAGATA